MRSSWGTIDTIKKGKVYRIRYLATVNGVYGRHSETIRGTRKQASDRLAELRVIHTNDAPCPTISQIWNGFLLSSLENSVAEWRISEQTCRQYKSTWNAHVEERWGDAQVDSIKPKNLGLNIFIQFIYQVFYYPFVS